jgi:hypothetical protein
MIRRKIYNTNKREEKKIPVKKTKKNDEKKGYSNNGREE